ncbi:hypothetical protein [Paraburkholderia phenazinium]|jgi:hypothetical protein|uniref:Uncharacterized protein n=1 Tax=Paraburkholderia phenazinium TaxID=60549 RepID=A0A1G7VVX4_9BURK|nr:hypothetical protein [Paraburkholderia phenazinium]SDG63579.1 hypothetical protein SAMN05216466_104261 [Paraburkholderia phenazinium]
MRLAFRIDPRHCQPLAALCAALLLVALPPGVNAQESVTTPSPDTGSVTLASPTPAAVTAPDTAVSDAADTSNPAATRSDLAGDALSIPADAAAVDTVAASDLTLDDQVLSQQRGGFSGMLMVAATPQLMRGVGNGGNGVTLWDEIAPPSPLPVPVDVARSAQGNVTSYQRN